MVFLIPPNFLRAKNEAIPKLLRYALKDFSDSAFSHHDLLIGMNN
jgi:hypothetical protein